MYEMMKVFDCQKMPDDVRLKFFEQTEGHCNSCYVSWWPTAPQYQEDDGSWQTNPDYTIVDGWLIANGADLDEKVVVRHSW